MKSFRKRSLFQPQRLAYGLDREGPSWFGHSHLVAVNGLAIPSAAQRGRGAAGCASNARWPPAVPEVGTGQHLNVSCLLAGARIMARRALVPPMSPTSREAVCGFNGHGGMPPRFDDWPKGHSYIRQAQCRAMPKARSGFVPRLPPGGLSRSSPREVGKRSWTAVRPSPPECARCR